MRFINNGTPVFVFDLEDDFVSITKLFDLSTAGYFNPGLISRTTNLHLSLSTSVPSTEFKQWLYDLGLGWKTGYEWDWRTLNKPELKHEYSTRCYIRFTDPAHAALFKLTWC